jgi:uncharacterized protein
MTINNIDTQKYNWADIKQSLEQNGYAHLPHLIDAGDCDNLADMFDQDALHRAHIHMSRYGFGRGEYKYLKYPLPSFIETVRHRLYPHLAPIANHWAERLSLGVDYPDALSDFLARCHEAGQTRPTPLLLRYGKDDYNCLHQDLYGDHIFPLQVIIQLTRPGIDFTGGELMLLEQRPRMQSIGRVLQPNQGDGVIIAVHHRPQKGTRGDYRVTLKHGVSTITHGTRQTLGIIFHDAA